MNHQRENTIGTLPAITVQFPREFPVVLLAALMAKAGYQIKWIRRGKSA